MMSASDHAPSSMTRGNTAGGGGKSGAMTSCGAVIRPQPVTEKSLMDSVAGFINEVQSFNQPNLSSDPKVYVLWARFEIADINDIKLLPERIELHGSSPPLLLILGYTYGVQVWLIPVTGEAQEVLSWKQGTVKTLRILSTPENCFGYPDNFAHCRPLISMADSTGPGAPYSSASFISLKSGEQVHSIKFNNEIVDIAANRRVVVLSFIEKLAVFDACSLDARFTVTTCYHSPGLHANPISLGDRWLAYAEKSLVPIHRSFGGMEADGSQSVAAWGINLGSKMAQGVSKIYSNIFSSSSPASGSASSAPSSYHHGHASSRGGGSNPTSPGMRDGDKKEAQKGVVTVLDILRVSKADDININDRLDGIVAHFIAHNKAIVAMQFDQAGSLLLTADQSGNYFNLFKLVPNPAGPCYSAVHHLYSLYRGDTPGSVQDIAFSPDSRWVAVSTLRGTTHIFPITPYGGPCGVRTHTSPRVVNRLSRFHRSAGLDDYRSSTASTSSGRTSPNPNLAGTSPSAYGGSSFSKMSSLDSMGHHMSFMPLVMPYPNPHIPPFPSPTLVQPVAQLRQPYIVTLTTQTIGSASSVTRKKSLSSTLSGSGSSSGADEVPIRLAVTFAPSRAWLVGTQHNMFNRPTRGRAHDALYVMANHGVLLEYSLDAIPESTLPKEKICESSPIELVVNAYGQWTLSQPRDRAELQPPLPIDSPLMLASSALAGGSSAGHKSAADSNLFSNEDEEEASKWLSQVEMITHVGPHRRLWMGPQFAFKTFQPLDGGDGEEVHDLDISARPEQSNPMNIAARAGGVPVMIEASSVGSMELSPHFANFRQHSGSVSSQHGGRDHHHSGSHHHGGGAGDGQMGSKVPDVASELQDAMSETVLGEETLLDGSNSSHGLTSISRKSSSASGNNKKRNESSEEEFFCLTPDDSRSLGGRSRNASAASNTSSAFSSSMNIPSYQTADTKIFSVAVEARKGGSGNEKNMDSMRICDVESDFSGRFAVVSEQKMPPERRPHQQHQQQQHQQHHQKQVTTTVPAKNEYYPTMEAVPKTLSTSASPATTTASAPVAIVPNLATPIPAPRERETVSPPKEGKKGKKNKKKKGSKSGSSSSNEEGQVEVEEFPVLAPTKSSHFEMPPLKPVKVAKSREVTPSKEEELIEIKKDEKVDILAEALPSKEVESRTCSAKTKSPPSVLEKSTEDISTHSDEFQEITNTKHETDEEEIEEEEEDEEEPFFIREKSESVEREEEETAPPNFKFNPDSSSAARPKMPSWMDDLIKSEPGSNPILKGIESAEKKYDEPSTLSAAGTIPKSSSTGFHLNFLRDAAGPSFKEKAPSFNLEDSSEDDFDFKPAYSRKAKKTKVKESKSNPDFVNSSSYADSESSLMMEDNCSIVPKAKEPTEGWSFEADDLDVNRIINEVVNNHGISAIEHPKPEEGEEEEKTRENLIFKFENELALKDDEDDDEEEEEAGAGNGKNPVLKSASLEDLKDALADDTTEDDSENDFKPASRSGKKMTTSLNVSFDEESLIPSSTARENLASSGLSGTSVGSTSDGSSVGNSPNPKKNKGKSKKKKRR